jgi:histidinol-phosphatase (PHP family)
VPLDRIIITWWREEGGTAISFASDAHNPDALAAGLREAAGWGRAAGFRPSSDPTDFWVLD